MVVVPMLTSLWSLSRRIDIRNDFDSEVEQGQIELEARSVRV